MTWNCEGFKRVSYELLKFCDKEDPDLIFISEPWLFQANLPLATSFFLPKYSCSLNSDDKLDPELPLTTTHAQGGVLVFWKSNLDQYVTTIDVSSSRFLIIVIEHPNYPTSIHIGIYLPTSGLDNQFVHELSLLEATIEELSGKHPSAAIFIRGDANASLSLRPGNKRDTLFSYFCKKLSFVPSSIPHPTYHHFVGNTSSSIDVLLQRTPSSVNQESVLDVICSKTNPNVDSKHDIILSSFQLPYKPCTKPNLEKKAPEILNTKHRIIWSETGIESFRELLVPRLQTLSQDWDNPQSSLSFSVLLQCTNEALVNAAKATNKVLDLTKESKPRKPTIPKDIDDIAKEKLEAHRNLSIISNDPLASDLAKSQAKQNFRNCRNKLRRMWRRHQSSLATADAEKVEEILTNNPKEAFKQLKSLKSTASAKISELKVENETFYGKDVADVLSLKILTN